MTEAQKRVINLFCELDEICRTEGIRYWLAGSTALQGTRSSGYEAETPVLDVFVLCRDLPQLIKALKNRKIKDREIESSVDNPFLKANVVRYVDASTLYLPLKNPVNIRKYGLCVQINPLYSKEAESVRDIRKYQYLYWSECRQDKWLTNANSLPSKIFRRIAYDRCKKADRTQRKKLLYGLAKFEAEATTSDTLFYFTATRHKKKIFPKGIFSDEKKIFFEGIECYIPSDEKAFFQTQIGREWKTKQYQGKEVQKFLLSDANCSYYEYMDYLKENDISIDISKELQTENEIKKRLKEPNRIVSEAWEKVLRTDIRIHMYQKYMPVKMQILQEYQSQNWDELDRIFAIYDEEMHKLVEKKMAVSFDSEIQEIYYKLLEHKGEKAFKKKVIDLIPEEYKKNLLL